ncbi:MAG: hypothetical protein AB1449_02475 [Chloroflexota bacterium]
MEKRYGALRIVGTVYKVLGIIAAVLTVLAVLAMCGTSVLGGAALGSMGRQFGQDLGMGGWFSGVMGGVFVSIAAILYGGIIAVTMYAFGEMIYLLIALEENTHTTAMMLQGQAGAVGPRPG